jgi:hypothetical protein
MTTTFAETHAIVASMPEAARDNAAKSAPVSKAALWGGRVASGFAVAFLAFDAIFKLTQNPQALEGTAELGYPVSVLFGIGVLEAVCLAFYLLPRTAVLGALLWTGYLGGAIATHVRVGNPLFSHVLFPIYVALFIWGGLWLRDPRVRALLPLCRPR